MGTKTLEQRIDELERVAGKSGFRVMDIAASAAGDGGRHVTLEIGELAATDARDPAGAAQRLAREQGLTCAGATLVRAMPRNCVLLRGVRAG